MDELNLTQNGVYVCITFRIASKEVQQHRLIRKPNEMRSMPDSSSIDNPDVILIGSGIMSSTLGAMLKRLQPDLKIQLYEVTNELAQ